MKLLYLKIDDEKGFRSLQKGFSISFFDGELDEESIKFNPYILIGPNGSGKSNVLEAISSIFYHIECMYLNNRPEKFEYDEEENTDGFKAEVSSPNAFILEYLIPIKEKNMNKDNTTFAHVKIEKKTDSAPQVIWVNRNDTQAKSEISIKRTEIKELLPKFVLGYSSGENELLSLHFYKMRFIHFDEYRDYLIRDNFYGQVPEGRLIYLDDQLSQAILLSNLILQPKDILEPFEKELSLKGVKEFRLIVKKNHYESVHDDHFATLSKEEKKDSYKTTKELTSNLEQTIEKFKFCSTSVHTTYTDEGVEEFLILDFFVNEATEKAFSFHFNDSPLELFQAFQILYTLNYCTIDTEARNRIYKSKNIYMKQDMASISLSDQSIFRIKEFQLDKQDSEEIIYTKSLSDGEHQFIHTLGLCLLFKDEPCLFLLDEPETHFNPSWKARFISKLRECFNKENASNTMREMLITTHTPYLVSDSKQENVLLFHKRDKTVHVNRPDFNTLGASINKITMIAFKQTETIGDYAMQEILNLRKRYKQGIDTADKVISEANDKLGDSVEKILFIKEIEKDKEG